MCSLVFRFNSYLKSCIISYRAPWDDDEPGNYRKSDWDYPTPRRHERYDDTPRPTPAHKYNKWAPNRRKTGATPATEKSKYSTT